MPAYDMRISDWSSDVCSSDLVHARSPLGARAPCLSLGAWPPLESEAAILVVDRPRRRRGRWRVPAPVAQPGRPSMASPAIATPLARDREIGGARRSANGLALP